MGQIPVDVSRLRCDYLTGTARKFLRGPRGVGFLYVSDRALERGEYPLGIDMRGAERDGERRPRLGMVTMRERAQAVGAQFSVVALPAGGTQVTISVPAPDSPAA